MIDKKEGALGRWSRRKRGGAAAPEVVALAGAGSPKPEVEDADAPDIDVATLVENPTSSLPEKSGAADPAPDQPPAPLPDIDSLDADSDYTPFLGKDVPEKLARKALRKLWMGDPVFNFRDGLDDYDENFRLYFTDAVAKTVKTVFQVAKGATKQDEPATAVTDEVADDGDTAVPESPEPTPVESTESGKESDDGGDTA